MQINGNVSAVISLTQTILYMTHSLLNQEQVEVSPGVKKGYSTQVMTPENQMASVIHGDNTHEYKLESSSYFVRYGKILKMQ